MAKAVAVRLMLGVMLASLAACDDDPASPGVDGGAGDGGADAAACPSTGGSGNVTIVPTGLPAGTVAQVNITGLAPAVAARPVSLSAATSATAGSYTVMATELVAPPAPMVRTAYRPRPTGVPFCVRTGETTIVELVYEPIASSGKVWVGNANADTDMMGFAPAALAASGAPPATVTAVTAGSAGFTFDRDGNLWVVGGTTADAPVARYAAATLATSGAKTPDVTIDSPAFGGGLPGPKALAFDKAGNLWVAVVFADKVVRFAPSALTASGMPAASAEIGGLDGVNGLAFDSAGNLWVTADGTGKIMRVDQAQTLLATGGHATLSIGAQSPLPVVVDLPGPQGLAFDKAGTLWVNFDGTIAAIPVADQAGTGDKTLTPAIQIRLGVTALPQGLAFDEGGGLFVALDKGRFGRISPAALAASGDALPELVIASPSTGYAGHFALFPAPAGLPLAHSLP